jgi:hypothetical protein
VPLESVLVVMLSVERAVTVMLKALVATCAVGVVESVTFTEKP